MRTHVAALAVERFERDRGRRPASLDELVPDYIEAVPLDPFDGQLLRYIRLDDGYVIYSVSSNGIDDGGALERENNNPPKDIGLRVQRPDLRGGE